MHRKRLIFLLIPTDWMKEFLSFGIWSFLYEAMIFLITSLNAIIERLGSPNWGKFGSTPIYHGTNPIKDLGLHRNADLET